jgi:topoisomerase-4 subunit A
MDQIDHRLEVLEGYIIAFLNLDRVIAIIRAEDEPKPVLIAEFDLTDVQAEAILNMRLRSLRRLEEMELRRERDALMKERADLQDLLDDEGLQWARIGHDRDGLRARFGKTAPGGARRTTFAAPTRRAAGSRLSSSAQIACLCGSVTPKPTTLRIVRRPATASASPPAPM